MKRPLLAILVLAFGIRLALLAWFYDRPIHIHDEKDYNAIAVNLAVDGQFALNRGTPCAARPPLYPALLALIYRVCGLENFAAVRFFQAVLAVLAVVVVYQLGLELLTARGAVLLAGLYAFYPSLLVFNDLLLTETLFTLLFCGMCLALIRAQRQRLMLWLAVAGVLCGLAALTRSALWVFPPVAGVWLLLTVRGSVWRRVGGAVVFAAAAYAAILPWAIRNSRLEKTIVVIDTMGGRNVMMGNYRYTPLFRSWDAVALTGEQFWFVEVIEHYPHAQSATQGQIDKLAMKRGQAFIRSHPALTLQRDAIKFLQFWGLERELIAGASRGYFGPLPRIGVFLFAGGVLLAYVGVFLASLLGIVVAPPDDWRKHSWLLLATGFLCALHTVVFAHSRYHLPVMPLLMVYAANLLSHRAVWRDVRRWRWLLGGAACLVFVAVWTGEVAVVEAARIKDVIGQSRGEGNLP